MYRATTSLASLLTARSEKHCPRRNPPRVQCSSGSVSSAEAVRVLLAFFADLTSRMREDRPLGAAVGPASSG